jgi:hypothetical protein
LHRGVMRRFQEFLDDLELDEVHLTGRLFTWSRDRPTLERPDRVFISLDWTHQYSSHQLRCLSSDNSDHAPCSSCSTPNLGQGRDFVSTTTRLASRDSWTW